MLIRFLVFHDQLVILPHALFYNDLLSLLADPVRFSAAVLPVILKVSDVIAAILEDGSAVAPPAIIQELSFIYDVFVVCATNTVDNSSRLLVELSLNVEAVLFLAWTKGRLVDYGVIIRGILHYVDQADWPELSPPRQRFTLQFLRLLKQELDDLARQLRDKLLLVEKLVWDLPVLELIGKADLVFDRRELWVDLEIVSDEVYHELEVLGVSVYKYLHDFAFSDLFHRNVVCTHFDGLFFIYGNDLLDIVAPRERLRKVRALDACKKSPRGKDLGFAADVEVDQVRGDAVSGRNPLICLFKLFLLLLKNTHPRLQILFLGFHLRFNLVDFL